MAVTGVPPIRGRSTPAELKYEAVVLLAVPPSNWAVAPTYGNHCARVARASASLALIRASAAVTAGWCSRA